MKKLTAILVMTAFFSCSSTIVNYSIVSSASANLISKVFYPSVDVSIGGGVNSDLNLFNSSEKRMQVTNSNSDIPLDTARKSYISFDISDIDKAAVTDVSLKINYVQGMNERPVEVFGISEGQGNNDYVEKNTITWNNAPDNNTQSSLSMTNDAVLLGALSNTMTNEIQTLSGSALKSFIKNDKNNKITFALVKTTKHTSTWSYSSTRSSVDLSLVPTLEILYDDSLVSYDIEDIKEQVLSLPQNTQSEKLKKAALIWYVREAELFKESNDLIECNGILNDVLNVIDLNIGNRANPSPNIVPLVNNFENNPYILSLENATQANIELYKNKEYKKLSEGYYEFSEPQKIRSEIANRLDKTSFLLSQPKGKYSGDSDALTDVLKCLEALFTLHEKGDFNHDRDRNDGNMNRFIFSIAFQSYLELQSTYPDLILPYKKAKWDNAVLQAAELQLASFGSFTVPTTNPSGAGWYANMDSAYMHLMQGAGMILNNNTYINSARDRSIQLESTIYEDGAFPYLGYSNESPNYHEVTVDFITNYYLLSGNEQAKEMLGKTIPYYPVTLEKGGLAEFSTTPYWKQYWDEVKSSSIDVIAGMFGDGKNRYIAQQIIDVKGSASPNKNGAIYYSPHITPIEPKRDYTFFDENIKGARGHYENFAFAFNGRDWKDDRGKFTFATGMIINNEDTAYPLNSALQLAYGAVYDTQSHAYMLAMNDKNTTTIDGDIAVFTTRYDLQKPTSGGGRSNPVDWGGTQQWIALPDRIIGVVETESYKNQSGYAMQGVVQVGNGRGSSSVSGINMSDRKNTNYTFGSMRIKLWGQNYCNYTPQGDYANYQKYINTNQPTYMEDSYYNRSRGYITMTDSVSLDTSKTYEQGEKRYYMVEALRDGASQADSIKRTVDEQTGLNTINVSINAQNKKYTIIHNPSNESKVTVLKDSCVYNLSDGEISSKLFGMNGQAVTIPPYGHIFIDENASDSFVNVSLQFGEERAIKLESGKTISAKVTYNGLDSNPTCIMALYDNNGALVNITFGGNMKLPSISKNYSLKTFIIDNVDTITPLTENIVLNRS